MAYEMINQGVLLMKYVINKIDVCNYIRSSINGRRIDAEIWL